MKKIFLLFVMLALTISVKAQIKVANDDYKNSLSASKYVTEPISIQNCFDAYNGRILKPYFAKNIVGDTLYTTGAKMNCVVVDHMAKSIDYKSFTEQPVTQGYYRVTGIFLSSDTGRVALIKELSQLVDKGYTLSIGKAKTHEELEKCFVNYNIKSLSEINTILQKEQLNNDLPCDIDDNMILFHRLESLDSSKVFYTKINIYNATLFLPVKFYNMLEKELKGNDVYMKYTKWGGGYVRPSQRKLKDALTGTTIFLKDSLFHCIDIVVNDKLEPCCVLESANTGKFAIMVNELVETDNREYCLSYYSSPTDKMTIWSPGPYQVEKGKLIRDRHFSASEYIEGEDWQIIKVEDLNKIYAETKRYQALTAAQQKQAEIKYLAEKKARDTKRKQELCNKYGNEFGTLIASQKVALGMNPEMCKQAWGTPTMISNMIDATGKYTVWKYNLQTIIFFHNGKVVRIQN